MEDTYKKLITADGKRRIACKLPPRLTVDVTVFPANGLTYVHMNCKGKTLSMMYEEFESLCAMKQNIDAELPWLYGVSIYMELPMKLSISLE